MRFTRRSERIASVCELPPEPSERQVATGFSKTRGAVEVRRIVVLPLWAKILTVALFIGVMTVIGWAWRQVIEMMPSWLVFFGAGLGFGLSAGFLLGAHHGEKLERQRRGDGAL